VHRPVVVRPETWVPRRWLPWQTAASSTHEWGSASAGNTGSFIGAMASLCAPTTTEAGTWSKTYADALGRGGRGRTGGYCGVWLATNAGAPRGGPDFEGSLGARNALERRGASVGAQPGRRGRRGGGAVFRPARRRDKTSSYFDWLLFRREIPKI
jgi:hypothetical protein